MGEGFQEPVAERRGARVERRELFCVRPGDVDLLVEDLLEGAEALPTNDVGYASNDGRDGTLGKGDQPLQSLDTTSSFFSLPAM